MQARARRRARAAGRNRQQDSGGRAGGWAIVEDRSHDRNAVDVNPEAPWCGGGKQQHQQHERRQRGEQRGAECAQAVAAAGRGRIVGVAVMLERIGERERVVGRCDRRAGIETGRQRGTLTISGPRPEHSTTEARIRTVRIEHHGARHQRAGQQRHEEEPPEAVARRLAGAGSGEVRSWRAIVPPFAGGAVRHADARHQPGGVPEADESTRAAIRNRTGSWRSCGEVIGHVRAANREGPPRPCVTPAAADAVRRLRPDTHRRLSGSRAGTACAASADECRGARRATSA